MGVSLAPVADAVDASVASSDGAALSTDGAASEVGPLVLSLPSNSARSSGGKVSSDTSKDAVPGMT